MSKEQKAAKPESTRTRRASVVISEVARTELHKVADVFELPLAQVRDAAGEVASEAILSTLRQRLGADRLKAAKAELARLEREMGGAAGAARAPRPEPEVK